MGKIEQSWEPGTLDKTRKNLGAMTESEAKKMMKVLGGEVMQEKSAPIDYSAAPSHKIFAKKPLGKKANEGSHEATAQSAAKPVVKKARLPEIDSKTKLLFDRLMMDDDYKIKPSYGFFNFVLKFTKKNEKLRKGFIEYTLEKDVEHFGEFVMAVKSITQIAPESFKEKLLESEDEKIVFLRTVGSWSLKEIKFHLNALQSHPESVTVLSMSNFIKATYRLLLKIYYLGENRVSGFFKELYEELVKFPGANKKKLSALSKIGITEWFYVHDRVIKGLYPILMRLCSKNCDEFTDFFTLRTAEILGFLEMTKYDLMLPNKKGKKKSQEGAENQDSEKKEGEEEKKEEEKKEEKPSSYVSSGLKILDQIFPQAGFDRLGEHPDMYPYFQEMYQFRNGYNLLSPLNPLQVTITLLRITEDFLQGCRDIQFNVEADELFDGDTLPQIMSEWALYREVLFERHYCEVITEFVNSEYSNPGDFRKSQYGLKLTTDMLWQTKYYFLPHFNFQQLILEKPKNDNPYRPLCLRTSIMVKWLSSIVKNISAAEKDKGRVDGVSNPWAKYHYGIQTPVSKRLNVVLGAKKPEGESKATNANLLKYTLCVISVLDWWLNSKASPAYAPECNEIYRISKTDGAPEFSVPLIENQNELFMNAVKAAVAKKHEEEKSGE